MSSLSSSSSSRRNSNDDSNIIVRVNSPPILKQQKAIIPVKQNEKNNKNERSMYKIAIICREIFLVVVALFSVFLLTTFLFSVIHETFKQWSEKRSEIKEINKNITKLTPNKNIPFCQKELDTLYKKLKVAKSKPIKVLEIVFESIGKSINSLVDKLGVLTILTLIIIFALSTVTKIAP